MTVLGPSETIGAIAHDFADGNFDYLPYVAPQSWCAKYGLNAGTRDVEIYPADILPELPAAMVEDLAQRNLEMLREYRTSNPNYQRQFNLFAPASFRGAESFAGESALKRAVIAPASQILGKISGPNRQLLDRLLEELGAKGDPVVDTEERDAQVFGNPFNLVDPSVPAQVHTHRRQRISLRKNLFVNPYPFHRGQVDEIEVNYSTGQVNSAVHFNP